MKWLVPATDNKKGVWSWIAYDWANSAFATTVMAAYFPIFFKSYVAADLSATESTAQLGLANSIGALLVALLAPILGSISDAGSYKKKLLGLFCYLGVAMTACLALLQRGDWPLACFLYAAANLGFGGSTSFYDALLPSVTTRTNIDYVSAAGYAWGYLGGGLLFALNVMMYQQPTWFGLDSGIEAVKWSFISVALWWSLFALPLFLFVKEPPAPSQEGLLKNVRTGLKELCHTARQITRYRSAVIFLAAFLLYNDGVGTTIKMAVDYGLSLGFKTSDLIIAILLVQFIGFPTALGFGRLAAHIHPKKGIYICIGVYLMTICWALQMNHAWEFYVLALLIGCVQGGIQALSRSYYARLFPSEKAGEFYGFYNLLGKFAGIFGPLLVGWCGVFFNSSRLGILSIAVLFLLGAALLTQVPEDKIAID